LLSSPELEHGKLPMEQPDRPRVLAKGWSKGGGSNDE
jgi:hypothetical protein